MKHLALLIALATLPNLAFAGTPLDNWEKKVNSVARDISDSKRFIKPKALCVCVTGVSSEVNRSVGVISVFRDQDGILTRIRTACSVPSFTTASGEPSTTFNCFDWLPISK